MPIVVVGGHTRNIGKTSVVAGLIAAMPNLCWTAVKITQFGHGVCSANGKPCDCETADHTIAISEERDTGGRTDSSRYLLAGATRSFWVRTRQGQLAEAMPGVRKIIERARNIIIESNSVLRFLRPDISLTVLAPAVHDFKPSALRYLDRVDAILVPFSSQDVGWTDVSPALLKGKPRFFYTPQQYCSPALVDFVSKKLRKLSPQLSAQEVANGQQQLELPGSAEPVPLVR